MAAARRVRNSAARSDGGAVGASWVSGADYAGLSLDTARQHYGTTVEPVFPTITFGP